MKRFSMERHDFYLLLFTSLCLTSTFFFFGPLQLYISNITELWFSLADMLQVVLPIFILATILMVLFGILIHSFFKQLLYVYAALLSGLGIAFYIQGNYIPFKYGILNGDAVDWRAYTNLIYISTIIWLAFLIIPVIFTLVFRYKYTKIMTCLSAAIVSVQCIALVGVIITTDFSKGLASNNYISNKGLYEVSDDKNIFVFILDSFDDEYFKKIYDSEPELMSFLDGFTYFTNMGGSYPNTRAALPYILTRQNYRNEQPYLDYIEESWDKSFDYYQELLNQGFEINIYTTMTAAISEKAKETILSNVVREKLRPSGFVPFEHALFRFVSMRFFPDALKKYIWQDEDLFENLKSADGENADPFIWDGKVFFQELQDNGLTLQNKKKYNVIHLDGTHTPFTFLDDYSENPLRADAITEAKANLRLLCEFINQLENSNVYDNSCIIVTGDHGGLKHLRNPILLIKGFNKRGDLNFVNYPVSHKNLFSTVLSELGVEDRGKYGKSVFEFNINDAQTEDRFFYHYTVLDSYDKAYLPDMTEYIIGSQSNKTRNFIPTGKIFTQSGLHYYTPYQYNLGEMISFNNTQNKSYFSAGISDIEGGEKEFVWSEGYEGQMRLYLNEEDEGRSYSCHITLHNWMPKGAQHVIIKSNNILLYDAIVTDDKAYINFMIPAKCIENDHVVLDFEYPDACSPDSISSNGDDRVLAIGFKTFCIEEQETTSKLSFLADGNAEKYFYEGFYHLGENGGTWSNEKASVIAALPLRENQNMIINYESNPAVGNTYLFYNGVNIGVLPHHSKFATEEIDLPLQYRSDSDAQLITFITDDATTYDGRIYEDTRILGIHISEINFTEND